MEQSIILRKFKQSDTEAVKTIIREAWHYDEFSSKKTADKMAGVFLSSCLGNQTYTQVAEVNQIPVGIIMGKDIGSHKCPFKYQIRQMWSILCLLIRKEGRTIAKLFQGVSSIDKELLKQCSKKYQGEVAFFAVSASARGKGVGKLLFGSLLNYMKRQNIRDFYLFTDTSCNYGFYEHQGMVRRCERKQKFSIKGFQETMSFFIYDYQMK